MVSYGLLLNNVSLYKAAVSVTESVMSVVRLGYKNEAKTNPKFEFRLLTGYVAG